MRLSGEVAKKVLSVIRMTFQNEGDIFDYKGNASNEGGTSTRR